VHAYNNTFYNARVAFDRNDRVAAGDVFDWHTTTGPGLDERQGQIFLHNVMAASDSFRGPLLEFGQWPSSLCDKLKNAQATEVDGNVYLRDAASATEPLIVYAPSQGENCASRLGSLDDFRKLEPAFEKNGVEIDRSPRSILKGPDLGHFELQHPLPNAPAMNFLPPEVRTLLGWSEAEAKTPGAFPLR
jgi:hypothetical protein